MEGGRTCGTCGIRAGDGAAARAGGRTCGHGAAARRAAGGRGTCATGVRRLFPFSFRLLDGSCRRVGADHIGLGGGVSRRGPANHLRFGPRVFQVQYAGCVVRGELEQQPVYAGADKHDGPVRHTDAGSAVLRCVRHAVCHLCVSHDERQLQRRDHEEESHPRIVSGRKCDFENGLWLVLNR